MASPRPTKTPAGWKPPRKAKSAVTPRAKQLVDLMNFGTPDGLRGPMTRDDAATIMGIGKPYARQMLAQPGVRQYLAQALDAMRAAEGPRNVAKAIEIRDDVAMDESAAGRRVQVEAMRYIDGEKVGGGVTVNVGVGIQQSVIAPGYQISVPSDLAEEARGLLARAGSTRNIESGEVEDIEVEPLPIAPPVPSIQGARPRAPDQRPYVHTDEPELKGPRAVVPERIKADWDQRRDAAERLGIGRRR